MDDDSGAGKPPLGLFDDGGGCKRDVRRTFGDFHPESFGGDGYLFGGLGFDCEMNERTLKMEKCKKCGGPVRVQYTFKQGNVRKRVKKCKKCGYSFTTSETVDKD